MKQLFDHIKQIEDGLETFLHAARALRMESFEGTGFSIQIHGENRKLFYRGRAIQELRIEEKIAAAEEAKQLYELIAPGYSKMKIRAEAAAKLIANFADKLITPTHPKGT